MRRLISTGSPFEQSFGYSRAVTQGDWCFISGTTGYDYAAMQMPAGAEQQARNCLSTIVETLRKAGFSLRDVVRVQYTLADRADLNAVIPALAEAFGGVRPAATMVIAGLIEPEMKIEIEATAFRDREARSR